MRVDPSGYKRVGYVRQNFWPLRSFTDLADVNAQARQWLKEVANQRQHRETGEKPDERFQPESLRPLPALSPDYRDTVEALLTPPQLRLSPFRCSPDAFGVASSTWRIRRKDVKAMSTEERREVSTRMKK